MLWAYSNSGILQSICYIAIINKGMKYRCTFFVVPGNGTPLLEMPDRMAKVIYCKVPNNTYQDRKWQINETENNSNDYLYTNNQGNSEGDYGVTHPNTETDRATSAKQQ